MTPAILKYELLFHDDMQKSAKEKWNKMNNVDISKASSSIMTLIHALKKDIFA